MKSKIFLSALAVALITFLTASSVVNHKTKEIHTSAQLGSMVITALSKSSFDEYKELFPSLPEIHETMNENREVYGANLTEAQSDFALGYQNKLLPALKQSFDSVLRQAKEKGIDWSTVKYAGAKSSVANDKTSITISFESNRKQYQIIIEKGIVIKGNWRIGQYVKLV